MQSGRNQGYRTVEGHDMVHEREGVWLDATSSERRGKKR